MKTQTTQFFKKIAILFILMGTLFISLSQGLAQDAKSLMFEEANKAQAEAIAAQAEVYSPSYFTSGMKYYGEADADYKKGKNLEKIRQDLKMAVVFFLKAKEATKLFKTHLADLINARNDAKASEGSQYRKKEWENAEAAFDQAAGNLEKGDLDAAKSRAEKAIKIYREVELESIKANYLDETRNLLDQAKDESVKKRAPLTLSKAEDLAEKSETQLSENRYDTDEARQLAQEAKYEAKHALFLSQYIKDLDKNETIESLLLNGETPIRQISDEFDLNPKFDQGFDPPAQAIIKKIQENKRTIASLQQDLSDRNEQIAALSEQVSSLSTQLSSMQSEMGDLKSKEETLNELMEQQRLAREKFQRVEQTFTPEEAQIVRVGGEVVIRLYGLTFPSGKSTIDSKYFGLLSKIINAAAEYPECGITVEGHTDSRGGDDLNQKISTSRAEAVREYLLATAKYEAERVIAVGYGETKPIAPNETQDGRRKNRRIEVVIHPKK
jgi:OOP family OmpA-OmpF porin